MPSALEAALRSFQLRAWSCALTLRIARISGDEETAWNTASGVLLEFGRRAVVATAWHVLDEFRRLRDSGETVALMCDSMPFLNPCTVFRDAVSDIALLEVPAVGRLGLNAVPHRPGHMWPPPVPNEGDVVLLCGFPRIFRNDGEEIVHGDVNFQVAVASAADGHFMLQIDLDRLAQAGRITVPPDETEWGGVSGGPVFMYDGGCNPLVGIVSEAGRTLPLWRIAALAVAPQEIEARTCEPV